MNVNEMYEAFINAGLFTEDEAQLVTYINGFSVETLEDMLYARYGTRDVSDVIWEEE